MWILTSQTSSKSRIPKRRSSGICEGNTRTCTVGGYGREDDTSCDIFWEAVSFWREWMRKAHTVAVSRASLMVRLLLRASLPTSTNSSHTQLMIYTETWRCLSSDMNSTGKICYNDSAQLGWSYDDKKGNYCLMCGIIGLDSPYHGIGDTGESLSPFPIICPGKVFVP